jgi:hypothetical protein
MRFRQSGVHDSKALEKMVSVRPLEFAKRSPLARLDFLMRKVRENHPSSLNIYITNLEHRYQNIEEFDYFSQNSIEVNELISDLEIMKENPKLAKLVLNHFLHNLLSGITKSVPDSTDVSQKNQLRAFLSPKYHNLAVLADTIGRANAIELYKIYHDEFMRSTHTSPGTKFAALEDLAEQWFQENTKSSPGLVRFISDVNEGKIILRKDTCLWNDAISNLDDQEFKYYICCYGDYESIKLNNSNFIMTMNHTIVEGHPYCDCVIHDTRINDDLSHPSDEFFQNIKLHESET